MGTTWGGTQDAGGSSSAACSDRRRGRVVSADVTRRTVPAGHTGTTTELELWTEPGRWGLGCSRSRSARQGVTVSPTLRRRRSWRRLLLRDPTAPDAAGDAGYVEGADGGRSSRGPARGRAGARESGVCIRGDSPSRPEAAAGSAASSELYIETSLDSAFAWRLDWHGTLETCCSLGALRRRLSPGLPLSRPAREGGHAILPGVRWLAVPRLRTAPLDRKRTSGLKETSATCSDHRRNDRRRR